MHPVLTSYPPPNFQLVWIVPIPGKEVIASPVTTFFFFTIYVIITAWVVLVSASCCR